MKKSEKDKEEKILKKETQKDVKASKKEAKKDAKKESKKASKSEEKDDKVVTRYDRKMEARRKEAKKEKISHTVTIAVSVVVILAIVGTTGFFTGRYFVKRYHAMHDPYLKVGTREISKVEYDYYFNTATNNYINANQYLLQYSGFDSEAPYDEQNYSEDETWQEFFEDNAIKQIKEEYALLDDLTAKGFTYDTDAEYAEFLADVKTNAKEKQMSSNQYLKSIFGEYGTKSVLKPYMLRSLIVGGYYKQLTEDNTPSDEDAESYYQSHKEDYDKLSYYHFTFNPSDYDEGTDLQELADAMAEEFKTEKDLDAVCSKYAVNEDTKGLYDEETTEYSLTNGTTGTYVEAAYKDWLLDESRKPGDVTVAADTENGYYYVVKFVERTYDENCIDSIKDKIAGEDTTDYVDKLVGENYEVEDLSGEISFLKEKPEEEASSESLLNTDIIE